MESKITITEASNDAMHPETRLRLICRVCQRQFSQYTCPRCNVRYCSLECYKKHSLRCTESFMRDNVMGELHQLQPTDETKQKMLDILKRVHSENEGSGGDNDPTEDEEDFQISEDTMRKVLEGMDVTLEDLSIKERKGFLGAVASGKLSRMFKPWKPWWLKSSAKEISLSSEGSQLVQSLNASGDLTIANSEQDLSTIVENVDDDVPPGPENPLPSVRQLTKKEPSPLISVHIIDVLYSYCFTLRFFNGDWKSDPLDAGLVCLSLSALLSGGVSPETVSESLLKCLEGVCSTAFKHAGGLSFGIPLMDDVSTLLQLGRCTLICALMDLHRLLEAASKEIKGRRSMKRGQIQIKSASHWQSTSQETKTDDSYKTIQSALRKIYFFMCWTNEQPNEVWNSLSALVEAEKSVLSTSSSQSHANAIPNTNKNHKKVAKTLIEELP